MKTLRKVPVTVEYHDTTLPEFKSFKEGVIHVSKEYKTAIHKCLCGCGGKTVTPLGDHGWSLYDSGKGITLTPSIGNYSFPCKSHYIITNGVANFV